MIIILLIFVLYLPLSLGAMDNKGKNNTLKELTPDKKNEKTLLIEKNKTSNDSIFDSWYFHVTDWNFNFLFCCFLPAANDSNNPAANDSNNDDTPCCSFGSTDDDGTYGNTGDEDYGDYGSSDYGDGGDDFD